MNLHLRSISPALFLAATLLLTAPAKAGVAVLTEVTAKGASPIENGQVTQARERAIHDALRRAVEQGVGVLLQGESKTSQGQLIKDKLYAKAEGFVEAYEVDQENQKDTTYFVTITAKVRKAKIAGQLVDLLVVDQQMDLPQIMVLLKDDQNNYGDPQRSARIAMVKHFTERRFRLINPQVAEKLQNDRQTLAGLSNNDFAAKLANEHAAEIVVVCTLNTEDKGTRRGLAQSQGILRMMAINPTTGQEFAGDEVELTGAGETSPEAARAAARRVATEAGEYAVNQLALWWIRQTGPRVGREFIVELKNPGNLLKVGRPFRNQIRKVQGVRQVKVESQSKALIRLRVLFEGGGKDLLIDGIAEKSADIPALQNLDLLLDRGNQLTFALGDDASAPTELLTRELPPTVAIVPFENTTDYAALDSTATACARRAESVCVASKKFRVVDRSRLSTVLQEMGLRDMGMLRGKDSMKLGKLLPANALVLGEISGQKRQLRINLRIIRTDTGQVIHTAEAAVEVDDRDRLPDQLEAALTKAIGDKKVNDYLSKLGLSQP